LFGSYEGKGRPSVEREEEREGKGFPHLTRGVFFLLFKTKITNMGELKK
jgi:hypothetical protein